METFPFEFLPVEIQLRIMFQLQPYDLLMLAGTNRYLKDLSHYEGLWKVICQSEIMQDDGMNLPPGFTTWREYSPKVDVYNQLRRVGHLFLNELLIVAGPQWEGVAVTLVQHDQGAMTLDWKVQPATITKNPPEVAMEEYTEAAAGLGVSTKSSISRLAELYEEISDACGDEWDGTSMIFRHTDGVDLSSKVMLSFYNEGMLGGDPMETSEKQRETEEKAVFKVELNPLKYCLINACILKEVADIHRQFPDHQEQLRRVLNLKRKALVDLNSSQLKLSDGDEDPAVLNLPIHILGTYSDEFKNWRWSWGNSKINKPQFQTMFTLKERSIVEGWPHANIFATLSIDCEFSFACALAHLAVHHLDSGMLVFPFLDRKSAVRMFLAIDSELAS